MSKMLPNISCFTLILSTLLFGSCARGITQVQTSPKGALVFASGDAMREKELGETPLNLNSDQFRGNRRFIKIHIKKDGYLPESFLVPASMFDQDIEISAELKKPEEAKDKEPVKSYEKLALGVVKAQQFIQSNQSAQARPLVESLLTEYKNVSVLYDFAGNIAYLNNNFAEALKYYEKSLVISPGKPETLKIVEELRKMIR